MVTMGAPQPSAQAQVSCCSSPQVNSQPSREGWSDLLVASSSVKPNGEEQPAVCWPRYIGAPDLLTRRTEVGFVAGGPGSNVAHPGTAPPSAVLAPVLEVVPAPPVPALELELPPLPVVVLTL